MVRASQLEVFVLRIFNFNVEKSENRKTWFP